MAQNLISTDHSSPPMKRSSEDDSDDDSKIADLPLSEKTMHPNLCFKDGNIIIETQSCLFRVHRGILGLHSTVFDSLFSLPQPSKGNDSYEGLPVVKLVGDNEGDITELLRTMYERNYYRKDQPASYAPYYGAARNYDAINSKSNELPFSQISGEPFTILSLARFVSADILLPALFYECALFDVDEILNYTPTEPDGLKWEEEDRSRCLAGRQKLIYATRETVFKFLDEPFPLNCSSPISCRASKYAPYVANFKFFTSMPLIFRRGYTQSALTKVWGEETMCQVCREIVKATIDDGRKELWERLPGYFGLPTWEVLKART